MRQNPYREGASLRKLAKAAASRLRELHLKHRLHLELRPEQFIVSADGEGLLLAGHGRETIWKQDGHGDSPAPDFGSLPEGLPYCSPESTGRMQRRIDERSDLYSLGAILYELVAGRPPFSAVTPLEWVYMHLAQTPPPLSAPGTPVIDGQLEAIIMKLLAKNPDQRYQTADQLIHDLDQAGTSGEAYVESQGFYGREYELNALTQAFYSACFGSTEIVYVTGEAGIGKTSLIHAAFRELRKNHRFYYISGKFQQLATGVPYQPVIGAFRGLVRHMLGEGKAHTEQLKTRLQHALGANAAIMTAIIPELELLAGSSPFPEELPSNESQKRFIYTFRRFTQALASRDCPIVLFIDDLQWADASSLQLIHALLCDPECQYLLFVCSYRPSELGLESLPGYEENGSISDQAAVRHLELTPLDREHIGRMMSETLDVQADFTYPLTEMLYRESGGNPFHFRQILLRLRDDHIFRYDEAKRSWQWDIGQMMNLSPHYAVQTLIRHRLERLSDNERKLLQMASCIGSEFDPAIIAEAAGQPLSVEDWTKMETEGLLKSSRPERYFFVHDSIQKLIYSELGRKVKQTFHQAIGETLLTRQSGIEDIPFDAINHLNQGSDTLSDPVSIRTLARRNLDAGAGAKAASAYDMALSYFGKGVELLRPYPAELALELGFELQLQHAECLYLCGRHHESEAGIQLLLQRASSKSERSRVQMLRIMQLINQGKYAEGTELGLTCLREHGINILPKLEQSRMKVEAARIEQILEERLDQLGELHDMSDPETILIMNLMFAITPSTFFTNKNVYAQLMCKALELTLQYGNTPVSAAVYTAVGMLLGTDHGNYSLGLAVGKVGVELSRRYNLASIKSKTYTIFGGVLSQFAGDSRESESYLAQALSSGLESGDYIFASYAVGAHVNAIYARVPLSKLNRTINDYMTVLETTRDDFVLQNLYLYRQLALALQGATSSPESFSSAGFNEDEFLSLISGGETAVTTLFQYCAYKTQLCFLLGYYQEAAEWARQGREHEAYATHLPHLAEGLFYELLARLALKLPEASIEAGDAKEADNVKEAYGSRKASDFGTRTIAEGLCVFRYWATIAPARYLSRAVVLEAEYARVSEQPEQAEALYDQAIREARESEDIAAGSIAAELAARHYRERGKSNSASYYLELALQGYSRWELAIKVTQLKELEALWARQDEPNLPPLANNRNPGAERGSLPGSEAPLNGDTRDTYYGRLLDLDAILKTAEMIGGQDDTATALRNILYTIVTYAGATTGALLTSNSEVLYVQAYYDIHSSDAFTPAELNDSFPLPEGVIRYTLLTQEMVRYSLEEESWLDHNPYIAERKPQSILCLPVTVHGTMQGALYLENWHAAGVFSSRHQPVLLAMAAHALFLCALQNVADKAGALPHAADQPVSQQTEMLEEPLTERELEVLALLAAGLSNKEIAEHLIIATGTVKVHIKNLFAKLKVNRRTKAIAQAKELKLLD
jgi:predicted ATPase/DNA-binding NarL/FixJ family response regulator